MKKRSNPKSTPYRKGQIVLANLLIGLREGLEAALVVGILVAYLSKIGRRDALPKMWAGVGLALIISAVAGILLGSGVAVLESPYEQLLAGALSIAAAGLITWMIFWMAKTARHMTGQLEGEAKKALVGSGWGLMFVALLAVGREGIETALFIWAAASSTGEDVTALLGAFVGLGISILLGFLVYKGMVRLNLRKFFAWSGGLLILVSAGVLVYGVAEWQEIGLLPGATASAFDITNVLPEQSVLAIILHGLVGFTPVMSWLQVVVWVLYVGVTMWLFIRMITRRSRSASSNATQPEPEHSPQAQLS